MKIAYYSPAKLEAMIELRHRNIASIMELAQKHVKSELFELGELAKALEESHTRVVKGLPVDITIEPVCEKCNDTHMMSWQDHDDVMCTFCPTPCEKCRGNLSAYCAGEPCPCVCHKKGT